MDLKRKVGRVKAEGREGKSGRLVGVERKTGRGRAEGREGIKRKIDRKNYTFLPL